MKKRLLRRQLLASLALTAARPVIGGQAVIEGVMMRSPHSFAVAVRRPDGTIAVREEGWLSLAERFPFLKWPLMRGANMLIESMYNGLSALNFSAEQALREEEDVSDAQNVKGAQNDAPANSDVEAEQESGGNGPVWVTMVFGLGLALFLFKFTPHMAAYGLGRLFGHDGQSALPMNSVGFHLVDGAIKLSIFVVYITGISMMADVKRLFGYHGAEHMSVHSWEAEANLDVENTKDRSTAHPRCGTSLILLVIATSVFVFAAVLPWLPTVSENPLLQSLFGFAVKIPLLLPIAGIAYELQRAAAKYPSNPLIRMFIAPGMLMQRLTTRQPDHAQLEVALTALRKAVWREARWADQDSDNSEDQTTSIEPASKKHTQAEIEIFQDFDEVAERMAA